MFEGIEDYPAAKTWMVKMLEKGDILRYTLHSLPLFPSDHLVMYSARETVINRGLELAAAPLATREQKFELKTTKFTWIEVLWT